MSDAQAENSTRDDVETALLDVELFLKYRAPARALERLLSALKVHKQSLRLREKLREVAADSNNPAEAARQCLALVSLYLARDDYETAQERLLEAKQLDPRISITAGLEAIRRTRQPQADDAQPRPAPVPPASRPTPAATFAGDLSVISIFDVVQVIENARLTGALIVARPDWQGRVYFNGGRIVGAESKGIDPARTMHLIVETAVGRFDFVRSPREFPITIEASSNTSLLLESLRQIDEQRQQS